MPPESYKLIIETDQDAKLVAIERADLETICAALHSLTQFGHKLYGLRVLKVERA